MNHSARSAKRAPDYTPAEHAILQACYARAARADLMAVLPGRTWKSIKNQARQLDLSRPHPHSWPDADVAVLRAYYPTQGGAAVGRLLNRPARTVQDYAHRLGLARLPKPKAAPAPKKRAAPARPPREPRPPRATTTPAPPKLGRAALVLPPPQPRSPATPQLNASRALRKASEKAAKVKPAGHVSADMIRALPAAHPARLAFTKAAYHGPAAAAAPYHEAMKLAA